MRQSYAAVLAIVAASLGYAMGLSIGREAGGDEWRNVVSAVADDHCRYEIYTHLRLGTGLKRDK